jgi:HEAT repeat protein
MIPSLIRRIEDEDEDNRVRWMTVELIGDLANHGEWQLESDCDTVDTDYEVEYHAAVMKMTPLLIKLLEDNANDVRCETVSLIGKLTDHGEWQLESIAASLIQTTKSSFVKPSQQQFHHSLNYLKTRARTLDGRVLS